MSKQYFFGLIFFGTFLLFFLNSCEKENLDTIQFTEKHLQGSWWLTERIILTERNGNVISRDTTRFRAADLPDSIARDTLKFFEDRQYSRNNGPIGNYTLDQEAEHIDFADTLGIWNLPSLKMRTMLLQQTRLSGNGTTSQSKTVIELFTRK
ncbi:MAG: hypothetical protein EOO99_07135 [Pedobacter sp.]|nr:MAG: hypothetical protein EOO99_07135 [Pedobacter sp.]